MAVFPTIPEWITVHLGPADADVKSVTVSFPDYIKNVASSELYPTWPESALRANILAQISFALNRVYTEYYRARGYAFDITADIQNDQSFFENRDIFENISRLVDEIFNSYLRRRGSIEPLFARYCDGVQTVCEGLSQWGSVALAEEGLGAQEILRRFYGEDVEYVSDVPVEGITLSQPLAPLTIGSSGNDVLSVQNRLNRISTNFPAIPKIPSPRGLYDAATREAVIVFQEINDLEADGIVGKATWYRIQYIYAAVKRLNELDSEGLTQSEISDSYPQTLQEGDRGVGVYDIQYMLSFLAQYEESLPKITPDGIYGRLTGDAVAAFRRQYELPAGREMDEEAYLVLYNAYAGILDSLPLDLFTKGTRPYPGAPLVMGSEGEAVLALQQYLNALREGAPSLPALPEDGRFGEETAEAVREYQRLSGLPVTGAVTLPVWESITEAYENLRAGRHLNPDQHPGFSITEGGRA